MKGSFNLRQFALIVLITSLWVNASEVFRYFVLVMPEVKDYWNNLEGIADMNWIIFSIWGIWDTLLTAFVVFTVWLCLQVFDSNSIRQSIAISSVLTWMLFVIFWVAAANMGYSSWSILWITLPLSLFEMTVASTIASKLFIQYARS